MLTRYVKRLPNSASPAPQTPPPFPARYNREIWAACELKAAVLKLK